MVFCVSQTSHVQARITPAKQRWRSSTNRQPGSWQVFSSPSSSSSLWQSSSTRRRSGCRCPATAHQRRWDVLRENRIYLPSGCVGLWLSNWCGGNSGSESRVGCPVTEGLTPSPLCNKPPTSIKPKHSFFSTEAAAFRWLSSTPCALLREWLLGIFPTRSLTKVQSGQRATRTSSHQSSCNLAVLNKAWSCKH